MSYVLSPRHHLPYPHVRNLAFSPNERWLAASVERPFGARVWRVDDAAVVNEFERSSLPRGGGFVGAQRLLLQTATDAWLREVEPTAAGDEELVGEDEHTHLAVSMDGSTRARYKESKLGDHMVLSVVRDGKSHGYSLWRDGAVLQTAVDAQLSHDGAVLALVFAEPGGMLVVVGDAMDAHRSWRKLHESDIFIQAALSANGARLAICHSSSTSVVSTDSGESVQSLPLEAVLRAKGDRSTGVSPTAVAFIDDDTLLVAYHGIGILRWDLADDEVEVVLRAPDMRASHLRVSPARRHVALALREAVKLFALIDAPT